MRPLSPTARPYRAATPQSPRHFHVLTEPMCPSPASPLPALPKLFFLLYTPHPSRASGHALLLLAQDMSTSALCIRPPHRPTWLAVPRTSASSKHAAACLSAPSRPLARGGSGGLSHLTGSHKAPTGPRQGPPSTPVGSSRFSPWHLRSEPPRGSFSPSPAAPLVSRQRHPGTTALMPY